MIQCLQLWYIDSASHLNSRTKSSSWNLFIASSMKIPCRYIGALIGQSCWTFSWRSTRLVMCYHAQATLSERVTSITNLSRTRSISKFLFRTVRTYSYGALRVGVCFQSLNLIFCVILRGCVTLTLWVRMKSLLLSWMIWDNAHRGETW